MGEGFGIGDKQIYFLLPNKNLTKQSISLYLAKQTI
jgi:hypothetical protein